MIELQSTPCSHRWLVHRGERVCSFCGLVDTEPHFIPHGEQLTAIKKCEQKLSGNFQAAGGDNILDGMLYINQRGSFYELSNGGRLYMNDDITDLYERLKALIRLCRRLDLPIETSAHAAYIVRKCREDLKPYAVLSPFFLAACVIAMRNHSIPIFYDKILAIVNEGKKRPLTVPNIHTAIHRYNMQRFIVRKPTDTFPDYLGYFIEKLRNSEKLQDRLLQKSQVREVEINEYLYYVGENASIFYKYLRKKGILKGCKNKAMSIMLIWFASSISDEKFGICWGLPLRLIAEITETPFNTISSYTKTYKDLFKKARGKGSK